VAVIILGARDCGELSLLRLKSRLPLPLWMVASKAGDVQKVLSLMAEDVVFIGGSSKSPIAVL